MSDLTLNNNETNAATQAPAKSVNHIVAEARTDSLATTRQESVHLTEGTTPCAKTRGKDVEDADIQRVVRKLLDIGENPTLDAVMNQIGRGSRSTYAKKVPLAVESEVKRRLANIVIPADFKIAFDQAMENHCANVKNTYQQLLDQKQRQLDATADELQQAEETVKILNAGNSQLQTQLNKAIKDQDVRIKDAESKAAALQLCLDKSNQEMELLKKDYAEAVTKQTRSEMLLEQLTQELARMSDELTVARDENRALTGEKHKLEVKLEATSTKLEIAETDQDRLRRELAELRELQDEERRTLIAAKTANGPRQGRKAGRTDNATPRDATS